jgi:hypothetical protein
MPEYVVGEYMTLEKKGHKKKTSLTCTNNLEDISLGI